MKTRFSRLSRITLNDWLEFHPYQKEVLSDHFYVEFSSDLQHELLLFDDDDYLVGGDYRYLACYLACYLEDIVSKTGLWTSFIDEHNKLYGKYLPFYDMAEYDRGNINLVDVKFLIWHFCSNLPFQNHFVDPFSLGIDELAKFVYKMLNEVVCQAPMNEEMKSALTLSPQADINTVKNLLDFFFFKCYLHQYYTTSLLEDEMLAMKNKKVSRKSFDLLFENRRLNILFNRVSPLLAQSASEMLANWIGEAHPLYHKFMSISKRKEGLFLYEGITDKHILVKHIASNTTIELQKTHWDFPLTAGKTTLNLGIVQWDNEWYAIEPTFLVTDYKPTQINEQEKHLFKNIEAQSNIIKKVEESFLEVNNNNRVKILERKRDAFLFIDKVWDAYHHKFGQDTINRKLFDVNALTFGVDEDLENLVVFFNPRAGMEFYTDIAQFIAGNKYSDNNAETNIEYFMLNEKISSDFLSFLIENQKIEIEPIQGERGYNYVWIHSDFLLRYWKKERYKSIPTLYID